MHFKTCKSIIVMLSLYITKVCRDIKRIQATNCDRFLCKTKTAKFFLRHSFFWQLIFTTSTIVRHWIFRQARLCEIYSTTDFLTTAYFYDKHVCATVFSATSFFVWKWTGSCAANDRWRSIFTIDGLEKIRRAWLTLTRHLLTKLELRACRWTSYPNNNRPNLT